MNTAQYIWSRVVFFYTSNSLRVVEHSLSLESNICRSRVQYLDRWLQPVGPSTGWSSRPVDPCLWLERMGSANRKGRLLDIEWRFALDEEDGEK